MCGACGCVTFFLLLVIYMRVSLDVRSVNNKSTTATGKKESSRPGKAFLAFVQIWGQVETRHKRLAEAIVCRLPMYVRAYLLVVHKVKSVFFSPHFCVCCYEL